MTSASERVSEYIAEGRAILSAFPELDFDSMTWQLPFPRAHQRHSKRILWEGIPPKLVELGKAMVAIESLPRAGKTTHGRAKFGDTLRWLGKVLGDRNVSSLGRKDLDLTCRTLMERVPAFSVASLKGYGTNLVILVKALNRRDLLETKIIWSNPWGGAETKSEKNRVIAPEILKAFGEIRAAVMGCDENDPDRLLVGAITILICTGMRVGELLSLPVNCWHEGIGEDDEGRILKGVWLGYAPEKNGLNENTMPKWIPSPLVPILRESIEDLIRITTPYRENAKALWKGEINIALNRNQLYSLKDLAELLGYRNKESARVALKGLGVGQFQKWHKAWLTVDEVTEYVRRRSRLGPVMTEPFIQELHESLFVIPQNFFNMKRPGPSGTPGTRGTRGTARPMLFQHIQFALKSMSNQRSLFERFNRVDPETGNPYAISSHDPRHTLTTWQIRHGIDGVRVAAYFGRSVDQAEYANSFYDHLNQEERMALVDSALANGRFKGGWATEYSKVTDPVMKEEVRHRLAGNVGYSQLGICSHPEGTTPPTIPEACSRCPGLIVIPGSRPHQKRAVEVQTEIQERISVYEAQVAEGVFLAGKWLTLEYERQARHNRVVEVLFSRPPLELGDEPMLVQMGMPSEREC
jgi:integrase